jgi:hypothetical protein
MSSSSGGGTKEKGPQIALPLMAPSLLQNCKPPNALDSPATGCGHHRNKNKIRRYDTEG